MAPKKRRTKNINSDDWQFENPVDKFAHTRTAERSLQRIVEDGQADRVKSKQALKQLQFGFGSPSHQLKQCLWVRRFEEWRPTCEQDLDDPFDGDDLTRFFDSILSESVRRAHLNLATDL